MTVQEMMDKLLTLPPNMKTMVCGKLLSQEDVGVIYYSEVSEDRLQIGYDTEFYV